jgi:hypothetical protein
MAPDYAKKQTCNESEEEPFPMQRDNGCKNRRQGGIRVYTGVWGATEQETGLGVESGDGPIKNQQLAIYFSAAMRMVDRRLMI